MNQLNRVFILITVFSIAMAFLETSVVIYLRELIYPEGFKFPLNPIPGHLAVTEILREASTIIILIIIAILTGKTFIQRFSWFIYAFAIWDIFYYVFLKVLTGWPDSLLTWDILFLIPITWTGPVISPCIVSLTMILLAVLIQRFSRKALNARILRAEWGLLITGSFILFISFIWDFSMFILRYYRFKDIWTIPERQSLYQTAVSYTPAKFNWGMFVLGELLILSAIMFYSRRMNKQLY